jgi:glutathione peroxidase
MASFYDFSAKAIDGREVSMATYRGKVVLVVNVASHCGFTPQYEGLQRLYERFGDRGLVILGFPCNQFAQQEPGDEASIESFCRGRFGVRFPMFAKVAVNGAEAHPLYQWLKTEKKGLFGTESIKWNFTKFLVGRDGRVLSRHAPTEKPEALVGAIEAALSAAPGPEDPDSTVVSPSS